jgi:hypothetical protein
MSCGKAATRPPVYFHPVEVHHAGQELSAEEGRARVVPFTSEETVAADSPRSRGGQALGLIGEANKVKPKSGDTHFLKTPTGKAVVKAKKTV